MISQKEEGTLTVQTSTYSIIASTNQPKSLEKDGRLYYRYCISNLDELNEPDTPVSIAKKVLSKVTTSIKKQEPTAQKVHKPPRLNHRIQSNSMSLLSYKRECEMVARQLGYANKIFEMIDAATTEEQVQSALVTGRHMMKD